MIPPPYLLDVALVSGASARVLGPMLRRASTAGTFDSLPVDVRAQVEATVRAIEIAGRGAAMRDRVAAVGMPTEPPVSVVGACSADDLSIDEAARVLGVGERRARQLAPALGRKVAGVWRIDRYLVEQEAARRAS